MVLVFRIHRNYGWYHGTTKLLELFIVIINFEKTEGKIAHFQFIDQNSTFKNYASTN